ncbi:hypothetical protein GCM10027614_80290 [Micromonospora vulcania]
MARRTLIRRADTPTPIGTAPCRETGPRVASQVIGYEVSYLPLRFECQLGTGETVACGVIAATSANRPRRPIGSFG